MSDALDPDLASPLAGVPAEQLRRWAWNDWDIGQRRPLGLAGPKNIGTRHKPKYLDEDVRAWKTALNASALTS